MAAFLTAACIPVVGVWLIERFESLELYSVLVLIVLAYVNEIVGELLIVLWFQVVLVGIGISCAAPAICHIVGWGVAESLEDGIWPLLLNLEHNLALCSIACPVVVIRRACLETFHLSSASLAAVHVV